MRKKIFLCLAASWMVVIFMFSAREASLSTQDSTSIGMMIGKLVVPGFMDMDAQRQADFAAWIDHPVRKTAHASEFAVLGLFLAGSYIDRKKRRLPAVCVPLVFGILYAVSDEVHQLFVPGRSCQLTDVMIDSSGVLAGVLAGLLFWGMRRKGKGSR